MAGKPITRGSARLAYAVDALSKNTLADLVLDRVFAEVGEDATDEQAAAHLQAWVDTIQRLRGDKPASLAGLLHRFDHFARVAAARQAAHQPRAGDAAFPRDGGPATC